MTNERDPKQKGDYLSLTTENSSHWNVNKPLKFTKTYSSTLSAFNIAYPPVLTQFSNHCISIIKLQQEISQGYLISKLDYMLYVS